MIAAHCVGSTAVLELLQVSADCSRLLMAIDGWKRRTAGWTAALHHVCMSRRSRKQT